MITPEYLEEIEFNKVVDLYNKLNISIMADIIERVSQMQEITNTTKEQLRILIQSNGTEIFERALKEASILQGQTKKELRLIFEQMAKEDMEGYKELYDYRGKDFKLNSTQYELLNQGLKQTNKTLKNFTNTIAFSSKQAYVQAIDEAYYKVVTGAFDYATVINQTAQKLADKGITLKDKAGRNVQLEVAIRRNIMSGIRDTANNLNKDIEKELGCDGYEVTAHVGARPTHAEEQGKQFAIRQEDAKEYGIGLWSEVEELWEEYNCRHSYFGIILGVSEPQYTDKELKEFKNATVKLNGKEIPYYEATQKQRALENQIRKTTRSAKILEKAGLDSTAERMKLRQLNKDLNNFLSETGLNKDYSRIKVANENNIKENNKIVFNQNKSKNKNLVMKFQENVERFSSTKIKTDLYNDVYRKNNIQKYENKLMNMYKRNKKENMAILDSTKGELFGDITTGTKTTVGPNTKTLIKMLLAKENSLIAIHNHTENFSFSLTDINTFDKYKGIKTMIVLTDRYKYYLTLGNGTRINSDSLKIDYEKIENEIRKKYKTFNDVEIRDLVNQKFFKEKGWLYEKEKNETI